jgi:hypothetical protein
MASMPGSPTGRANSAHYRTGRKDLAADTVSTLADGPKTLRMEKWPMLVLMATSD